MVEAAVEPALAQRTCSWVAMTMLVELAQVAVQVVVPEHREVLVLVEAGSFGLVLGYASTPASLPILSGNTFELVTAATAATAVMAVSVAKVVLGAQVGVTLRHPVGAHRKVAMVEMVEMPAMAVVVAAVPAARATRCS